MRVSKLSSLFLFATLSILTACSSISAKKYGFKGEYIKPFRDGSKYIEARGDAKPIAFILKEQKGLSPQVLIRFTTGALGRWFEIDYVELTLPNGKGYSLRGLIERWGTPTKTMTWTTTLTSIEVVQKYPMRIIVNETPTYDGQIYTWTESLYRSIQDKEDDIYRYRIETGRYNIKTYSSMTYEAIFAGTLTDDDLTTIARAETVNLVFVSRDANTPPQDVKGIYNAADVKQAVMSYYFKTKEFLRVQAELDVAKGKK